MALNMATSNHMYSNLKSKSAHMVPVMPDRLSFVLLGVLSVSHWAGIT